MSDPVISPDGKWMWTGDEWIPTPPGSNNASVSLQDSVVAGDVNITQNNAEDIASAMVVAFERIGFKESSPSELTEEEYSKVEELLLKSQNLGLDNIDPSLAIMMGEAAELSGQLNIARIYFDHAGKKFNQVSNKTGQARVLKNYGNLAYYDRNYEDARQFWEDSLSLSKECNNHTVEASCMLNLGTLASIMGDDEEAERLTVESFTCSMTNKNYSGASAALLNLGQRNRDIDSAELYFSEACGLLKQIMDKKLLCQGLKLWGKLLINKKKDLDGGELLIAESLSIAKEIGYKKIEASCLINLGQIAEKRGDSDKMNHLYSNGVRIIREIGLNVPQKLSDMGY